MSPGKSPSPVPLFLVVIGGSVCVDIETTRMSSKVLRITTGHGMATMVKYEEDTKSTGPKFPWEGSDLDYQYGECLKFGFTRYLVQQVFVLSSAIYVSAASISILCSKIVVATIHPPASGSKYVADNVSCGNLPLIEFRYSVFSHPCSVFYFTGLKKMGLGFFSGPLGLCTFG
ncbi:hypothetical protein Tco_1052378 [Tanacetum coccineum]